LQQLFVSVFVCSCAVQSNRNRQRDINAKDASHNMPPSQPAKDVRNFARYEGAFNVVKVCRLLSVADSCIISRVWRFQAAVL